MTNNNANIYIGDGSNENVQEYAVSNRALVGGFSITGVYPGGLAVSSDGSHLFMAEENTNLVKEYNAATGSSVGYTLSPAPGEPVNIALSGTNLFVADDGGISGSGSQVEEYTTTNTGMPVAGFNDITGICNQLLRLKSDLNRCLLIPRDLIFDSRVDLGMPSLKAAPDAPSTRPRVALNAASTADGQKGAEDHVHGALPG